MSWLRRIDSLFLRERRAVGWFSFAVGTTCFIGSVLGLLADWATWRTDALVGLFWPAVATTLWARGKAMLIVSLLGGAGVLVVLAELLLPH
jgi:hypothetical protein